MTPVLAGQASTGEMPPGVAGRRVQDVKTIRIPLAIVIMAAGLIATAGPSSAHTDLVSTSPVAGAVLAQVPSAVVLTFNEALLADTVSVSISDATGTVLPADPAQLNGAVVTAPWPATASGGSFVIAYRVVSEDGHPVTGSFAFTIEASADATAVPTAIAAAPATATNTASPAASPATTPPWPLIAIVFALAAVVGVVLVISTNRRRRISHK